VCYLFLCEKTEFMHNYARYVHAGCQRQDKNLFQFKAVNEKIIIGGSNWPEDLCELLSLIGTSPAGH
jgi:hypothetical protein